MRNNNSSRFGKFLKLQFTRDKYRLVGAFIDTYLLEKSRVLTPGQVNPSGVMRANISAEVWETVLVEQNAW